MAHISDSTMACIQKYGQISPDGECPKCHAVIVDAHLWGNTYILRGCNHIAVGEIIAYGDRATQRAENGYSQ